MTAGGTQTTGDRRPIKTREKAWAGQMAHWLVERKVAPNAISVAGMIAGILAGGCFAATLWIPELARLWWLLGAGFVQLRLLANMLDGMVAVESNTASRVGELYNEIPDRVSDAAILIGLGWTSGGNPMLGLAVAGLAVFVAYVRATGAAAGAGHAFCGPMAKPQRMFAVTVAALYCGLSPLSFQTLSGRGVAEWVLWLISVGCIATVWRRIAKIARTLRGGSHG